jgi:hypothetical protein
MEVTEQKILEAFDKNRPYLIDIEKLVKKTKYGLLNFSLQVHDSKVTGWTVQVYQKVRYEVGPGGEMKRISEKLPETDLKLDE